MSRVFLSYSRADTDAVAPLVAALRALGVEVWQDTGAIGDFDPIQPRIVDGLAGAAALLAWYSKSYAARPYCQWELTAAWLATEAKPGPPRVLVVNGEVDGDRHIQPERLREHAFAGSGRDMAALAARIRDQLAALPGPMGDLPSAQDHPWYGRTPPAQRHFVGRLRQLWRIHDGLKPGALTVISASAKRAGTPGVQVQGLGGVGKTMLAEEYALRFGGGYPGGVFWLTASEGGGKRPENFDLYRQDQLDRLARDRYPELWEASAGQRIARLTAELRQREQPYLWVVDDWPHGAGGRDLEGWRALGVQGHTLITTRERGISGTGASLDLDCLEPEEALALLARHRPQATEDEREAAAGLARRLGRHPLALDVAGAAIRQQGYRRFLDLLDRAQDKALAMAAGLREMLPTGHERDIVATLSWSLSQLDEPGRDLLRLAGQLATAPIPVDLLKDCLIEAGTLSAEDADFTLPALVDQVASRSLLTQGEDRTVTVHALIAPALAALSPAPERTSALTAAAVAVLGAVFAKHAPDIRQHHALPPLLPHATHLTARAEDAPTVTLLGWLAWYDRERGAYTTAAKRRERRRVGHERILGSEHLDTPASMNNLAEMLGVQGDHAGARALEEQVLEFHGRVLGPEHPDTLISMNNLAETSRAQGDYARARALDEQVLELRRRVLGPEHPDTLISMNNLAETLGRQGDRAGARALHEQVLELGRRVLGPEHPDTLISMNNLAGTLRVQGDYAGTRALHEQVLELRRRVLGPEHPDTLQSMNNLAITLWELGERAAAVGMMTAALDGRRRVLGEGHPDTQRSARNLKGMMEAG